MLVEPQRPAVPHLFSCSLKQTSKRGDLTSTQHLTLVDTHTDRSHMENTTTLKGQTLIQ